MDAFELADRHSGPPAALLALLLAAALLAAAGGCGDSGAATSPTGHDSASAAPSAPAALVRRAAQATLAAPAGLELRLERASAFGSSSAPVLGSGEFDFPAASGNEAVDLGETGNHEPGNEQVLFLSEKVYLQPKGHGTTVLPAGKQWMAAGLTGSEAVDTNFPSFTLQAEAVNPQLQLSELEGGAVRATPTETALVEGVPARRYQVTVDLARALSTLSGPAAPALAQAIQTELTANGGELGNGQTVISAWVAGGRIARMQSTPPGAGAGLATMTLCCYGVPVRISPPPAGRVVDISSLTPSGERENNGGGDSDGG